MATDNWSLEGKGVDYFGHGTDFPAEYLQILRQRLIKDLTKYFIESNEWHTDEKSLQEQESKKDAEEIVNRRFGKTLSKQ